MKRTINLSPGHGTLLACVLFLISIALAAFPGKATAQTIYESEGLNFTLNPFDNTANVFNIAGTIASDLSIPATITYDGTEYKVTTIGDGVFRGNTSINSVVIPYTVKKIGQNAFLSSTLTSVTLNEGLETINDGAFYLCNITEVTIPASVTSIGNYGLASSTDLSVTCLGSTPATAVAGSFNSSKLKQIRVPADAVAAYKAADGWSTYESIIQAIHPTSFTDAAGFTYTLAMSADHTYLNATLASRSKNLTGELEIPEVLKNDDGTSFTWNNKEIHVVAIAPEAFSECTQITKLTIPNTVKEIGEYCFEGCTNMTVYYNGDPAQIIDNSGNKTENAYLSSSKYYPILIVSADKKAAFKDYNGSGSSWGYLAYIYSADELKTLCLTDGADITTAISEDGFYKAGALSYKRTFNTPGQYATTCLPFAINPADYADKLDIYRLTTLSSEYKETGFALRMDETKIILSLEKIDSDDNSGPDDNTTIYPLEPLFVKAKEGVSEVTFKSVSSYTGKDILKTCELPSLMPLAVYDWDGNSGIMSKANDITLNAAGTVYNLGADSELLSASNIYTFNADGSFGRSDEVHAFRMFITTPKQSAQMSPLNISIGIEGQTTGIDGITDKLPSGAADKTAPVYSLDGKMVSADGSTDGLKKGIYIKNKKKFVVK